MPQPARRFCATPGCGIVVARGHCQVHTLMRERLRPNIDVRQLYQTPRWRYLRAEVLQDEPLCRVCRAEGRVEPATDVDHVVPHRGDLPLFWDRANLQPLCHACHSAKTQRGE